MQNCGQKLGRPRSRSARGVVCAALLFFAAACSVDERAPKIDVDRAPASGETRAGTLLAEYPSGRAQPADSVRIHAQFLDIHGIEYGRALEALEVWSPDFELDLDACELHSASLHEQAAPEDIRLELLDLGPITVDTPEETILLQARRLPDLLSLFSGVIYGTEQGFGDQPARVDFQPGESYVFSAPGNGPNGGFQLSLEAPRPIYLEYIGDEPVADAASLAWDFGDDLNITWRPSAQSAEDVFLRISAGFGPDRPRLNCRLEDDGTFHLPAALIQQIAADSSEIQVSLRRINARKTPVDGLERAEFIFSTVDQITLVDTTR